MHGHRPWRRTGFQAPWFTDCAAHTGNTEDIIDTAGTPVTLLPGDDGGGLLIDQETDDETTDHIKEIVVAEFEKNPVEDKEPSEDETVGLLEVSSVMSLNDQDATISS